MGSQTETRRIVNYDIDDVGAIHPQYWQGVSTTTTEWSDVYAGLASNAYDALEDAIEQAAMDGWGVDAIPNALPESPSVCDLCLEMAAGFGIDDGELDMDGECAECEMVYCVTLWVT